MSQQQRDSKRNLAVLEYAKQPGNVAKPCRRPGDPTAVLPQLAARARAPRRGRPHEPRPLSSEPRAEDATRTRALRSYEQHTPAGAIGFIDHVARALPVPHPHRQDGQWARATDHVPLARGRPTCTSQAGRPQPRAAGPARCHLTDKLEYYQLLDCIDDIELAGKLAAREESCKVHRLHGELGGLTPHEILREKLTAWTPDHARSGRSHPRGDAPPHTVQRRLALRRERIC
jgi:hypothetical protein